MKEQIQQGRFYLVNKFIVQMKKVEMDSLGLVPLFKIGMQFIYNYVTKEPDKTDNKYTGHIYTLSQHSDVNKNHFWECEEEPMYGCDRNSITRTEQELYNLMENKQISFIYNNDNTTLTHQYPYTVHYCDKQATRDTLDDEILQIYKNPRKPYA